MRLFTAFIAVSLAFAYSTTGNAYQFGSDVPAEIQEQIKGDLAFMASIQSAEASKLHQDIFGAVSGDVYKKFFESRVTFIGMNACGGGAAVACVIPLFGPSRMWLTQNYIKFSHPQVSRSMVVYHEARHTETQNRNWPHATCPTPFKDEKGQDKKSIWTGAPLAGEAACDITTHGSYGSSAIMLKNISKFCSSCTEKVKMDAGLYADDQVGRLIDKNAIENVRKDLYQQ